MKNSLHKLILSLLVMIPVSAQAGYQELGLSLEKNDFSKAARIMRESGDTLSQEELSNLKKITDEKMNALQQELLKNESILQKLARFAWIPTAGFLTIKNLPAATMTLSALESIDAQQQPVGKIRNNILENLINTIFFKKTYHWINLSSIIPTNMLFTLVAYMAPRTLGLIQIQTEEMRQLAYLQTLINKHITPGKSTGNAQESA